MMMTAMIVVVQGVDQHNQPKKTSVALTLYTPAIVVWKNDNDGGV
jgi:hypothetical protein